MDIHIKKSTIGKAILVGVALIYRKREQIKESFLTYRSWAGDLWFDHGIGNFGKIYHEAHEDGTKEGFEEGYCVGYVEGDLGKRHRFADSLIRELVEADVAED